MLVQGLPSHWVGFFAAVMAGAILSSFNSALNSAVTLFSVGIFKRHIRPQSSDKQLVKVGTDIRSCFSGCFHAGCAFHYVRTAGFFGYLQMVNGCYSIPILTIILVGMFTKKVPAFAAKKLRLCSGLLLTLYLSLCGRWIYTIFTLWLFYS